MTPIVRGIAPQAHLVSPELSPLVPFVVHPTSGRLNKVTPALSAPVLSGKNLGLCFDDLQILVWAIPLVVPVNPWRCTPQTFRCFCDNSAEKGLTLTFSAAHYAAHG